MKGLVFNIQKFCVHDGDGIRTMVFLKGCPLHCKWCSNPESQSPKPELAYNSARCLGALVCGLCVKACQSGAICADSNNIRIDKKKCLECMACIQVCPAGAQTVYGSEMSVDSILDQVEEDSLFYSASGGGLTLSGGEVLYQPKFAISLLRAAQKKHLDRAIETCGYCSYEHLRKACTYLNLLIYDLKHMDNEEHSKGTGVSNQLILENFLKICKEFPDLPILVRTPLIPGFNDNPKTIQAIMDFLPTRTGIRFELLPYHRMGLPKYQYLGRAYPMGNEQLDKKIEKEIVALAEKWRKGNLCDS